MMTLSIALWAASLSAADFTPRWQPFPLTQVQVTDSRLLAAREANLRYLLSLDTDRLLWAFRKNAGLPTPGEPLGGWEAPGGEVRGHFVGHYLSACALMYESTGNEAIKARALALVRGLAECQQALGGEYLSAFPESFITRWEKRERVWAPFYTIHKLMAGLLDVHLRCGDAQAREVLEGMVDYFLGRLDRYSDDALDAMINGNEEGGVIEVLWNLHGLTGKEAPRRLAEKMERRTFLRPMANGDDVLNHRHGNTHIPIVTGAARRYELTGEAAYRAGAQYFWDRVVVPRAYATGGSTDSEIWGEPFKLAKALSRSNHETCKTHNMLKLTRHLLCWTGDRKYGDFYERAFLNGILGTQEPSTGLLAYYLPMQSGYQRVYGSALDAFWCCTGTGVETWSKLGDSTYFQHGDEVLVNLFMASVLDWKEQGLRLEQRTEFPEDDTTELTVHAKTPVTCAVSVRVPGWTQGSPRAWLNGEPVEVPPGALFTLRRVWNEGDTLRMQFPMILRTVPMPDDPNLVAFQYGPVVLAGVLSGRAPLKPVISGDPQAPEPDAERERTSWYFVADSPEDTSWLKPVEGKRLTFRATGQLFELDFAPVNQIIAQRYGIYFPVVPKGSPRQLQLENECRASRFAQVADSFAPGGDVAALQAEYAAIAQAASGESVRNVLRLSMARIFQRADRLDEAKALLQPLMEPFVVREQADALYAILGAPDPSIDKVCPLLVPLTNGDGASCRVEVQGQQAVATEKGSGRAHLYFALPPGSLLRGLGADAEMEVCAAALEGAAVKFVVNYDAVDDAGTANGAYRGTDAVEIPGDGAWHTVKLRCPKALFGGRQNGGADFRLVCVGAGDVAVRRLTVSCSGEARQAIGGVFQEGGPFCDSVTPGTPEETAVHALKGEGMANATHLGHGWRHAEQWWSWNLRIPGDKAVSLRCVYWGSDVNRCFDILVDGTKVAQETLNNEAPGKFFARAYAIPRELTQGKDHITVAFRKVSGFAGGVFQCATQALQ